MLEHTYYEINVINAICYFTRILLFFIVPNNNILSNISPCIGYLNSLKCLMYSYISILCVCVCVCFKGHCSILRVFDNMYLTDE